MKVLIKISKQRIIAGKGDGMNCPIDRAVNDKLKSNLRASTSQDSCSIRNESDMGKFVYEVELPEKARQFVSEHDKSYKTVAPTQFYLKIPKKYLK